MIVSIIAAMGRNRGIGYRNALPWKLPADLAYFKGKTLGHHVLMGRKTFESIGRVLPGRTFIVISRQSGYSAPDCLIADSIDSGLELARAQGETEVFIIGGMDVYRQALGMADRIYLTLVDAEPEADAFFPELEEKEWERVQETDLPAGEKNAFAMKFVTLERVR